LHGSYAALAILHRSAFCKRLGPMFAGVIAKKSAQLELHL